MDEWVQQTCKRMEQVYFEQCDAIQISPASGVIAPLMLAHVDLKSVAELEAQDGLQETGLAHAMLRHLESIIPLAYQIAIGAVDFDVDYPSQAIIKQIEGMEEPTE